MKWGVRVCDLIHMWFCFRPFGFLGLFFYIFFFFSFLWFSGNESPKWPSVFLMERILSVVASWFLLNPTVVCAEMLCGDDPSVQSLWWPFGFDLDQCPYTPIQKDPCCSLWASRFQSGTRGARSIEALMELRHFSEFFHCCSVPRKIHPFHLCFCSVLMTIIYHEGH